MTWNKAAMQWANYRSPKPRVMHGPVGEKCLANTGLERCDRWVNTSIVFAPGDVSCCSVCGYHVCHCPPKPSNAELCAAANARMYADMQPVLPPVGSWDWAKARMIEDACTVRGVSRQFRALRLRHEGSAFEYQWLGHEEWFLATPLDQRAMGKELFEVAK